MSAADIYLEDVRIQFRKLKALAEDAVAQITDEELVATLDAESNSVAVIMKHIAGNLRSRFADFLTADGEKPNRNRDGEFVIDGNPGRAAIMADWNGGWLQLFATLDSLQPGDLLKDVQVRGERLPALAQLNRQLAHHASHVGQIVFLAKHFRAEAWRSLSIPRKR
jgi:hypothetical protein